MCLATVGIISSNDIIYGQLVPQCVWCVVYWGRYVVSNPLVTRNKSYCDFNKGIKKKQYFISSSIPHGFQFLDNHLEFNKLDN